MLFKIFVRFFKDFVFIYGFPKFAFIIFGLQNLDFEKLFCSLLAYSCCLQDTKAVSLSRWILQRIKFKMNLSRWVLQRQFKFTTTFFLQGLILQDCILQHILILL